MEKKNARIAVSKDFKRNADKALAKIFLADRCHQDGIISDAERDNETYNAFISFGLRVLEENC